MIGKNQSPDIGASTQFKPGESGNPAGRPEGAKSLSTHIKELLNDESFKAWVPDAREGVKLFEGAPIKAILQALAIRAMAGDTKAFDALAKYGYGTKIDLTSGDQPLRALVEFVGGDGNSQHPNS